MVGMDGCHQGVFNRGWTPFITSLLKGYKQLDIYNDLLSRGWLEIATGQHAIKTGALYDLPTKDANLNWSNEFKLGDIPGLGETVKPIWQVLNEHGYKVGIMNLPTTFPAPKVDGFFVSGGGGGAPVTAEVQDSLCYPTEIKDYLNKSGYIIDERLYQLMAEKELLSAKEIMDRLSFKNSKRTEAFVHLSKEKEVDFGFVVYKTSSVFAETFYNTEIARNNNSKNIKDTKMLEALEGYYRSFDDEIRKLAEEFPESEILFVSDHGSTERKFSINPNVLLMEHNLYSNEIKKNLTKLLVSKAKEIIPFKLKAYLKKSSLVKYKNIGSVSFGDGTKAFCNTMGDWVHGVYINDERFSGPVKQREKEELVRKVVSLINNDPIYKDHNVKAVSQADYKATHNDAFPDVIILVENGYLTDDKIKNKLEKFLAPESKSVLSSITKGDILNIKSHSPIFMLSNELLNKTECLDTVGDLTEVYKIICKYFGVKA
nr:alkaline phosphatase family protein [Vibrio coralliilyticus]